LLLKSDKNLEECREEFQNAFRSTQIYGKIWRRRGKYAFYITNRRHWRQTSRDPGLSSLIFVYCRGIIEPAGTGARIQAGFWYGCNMLDLMLGWAAVFFGTLLFGYRYISSVPLYVIILLAVGIVAVFFVISFFSSVCSMLGSDDKDELIHFLTSNLQAGYCLEEN